MKSLKFLIISFLVIKNISAQDLVHIADTTLTVESASTPSGNSRISGKIIFPEKTREFVYRISIWPAESNLMVTPLVNTLQEILSLKTPLASVLPRLSIKDQNNDSLDVYIFSNFDDANKFLINKEREPKACKILLDSKSSCASMGDCIEKEIYFGFHNNSKADLDVTLEIVPLLKD